MFPSNNLPLPRSWSSVAYKIGPRRRCVFVKGTYDPRRIRDWTGSVRVVPVACDSLAQSHSLYASCSAMGVMSGLPS